MSINVNTPFYDAVRALPAEARFVRYITERYNVRARRLSGERPERWTEDPILRTYKFTNVKRDWDYTSTWLQKRWYAPNSGHELIGLLCATARFICLVDSLRAISMPSPSHPTRSTNARAKDFLTRAEKVLTQRQDAGHKVFTSAYMIGGVAGGQKKVPWVIWEYLWPAWQSGHLGTVWTKLDDAHTALHTLSGWGHFMTQEVVLDIGRTWLGWSAADRETYAYAGPGAVRGLNRVYDREYNARLTQYAARAAMRELYDRAKTRIGYWRQLPTELQLTVHDIEFNLCEYDKYERVLFGDGVPKQKFRSHNDAAWQELT